MFDYDAAAELFSRRSGLKSRNQIGYRRFSRASDAILFAIETLPSDLLAGASLEVDDQRFNAGEIRTLYDDAEFPLRRSAT
jgi:hypothetical protein